MKVDKYSILEVLTYTTERAREEQTLVVSSLTVNWCSILTPQSMKLLTQLRLIKDTSALISVRALHRSTSAYDNYMGTSGRGNIGQRGSHCCMLGHSS